MRSSSSCDQSVYTDYWILTHVIRINPCVPPEWVRGQGVGRHVGHVGWVLEIRTVRQTEHPHSTVSVISRVNNCAQLSLGQQLPVHGRPSSSTFPSVSSSCSWQSLGSWQRDRSSKDHLRAVSSSPSCPGPGCCCCSRWRHRSRCPWAVTEAACPWSWTWSSSSSSSSSSSCSSLSPTCFWCSHCRSCHCCHCRRCCRDPRRCCLLPPSSCCPACPGSSPGAGSLSSTSPWPPRWWSGSRLGSPVCHCYWCRRTPGWYTDSPVF